MGIPGVVLRGVKLRKGAIYCSHFLFVSSSHLGSPSTTFSAGINHQKIEFYIERPCSIIQRANPLKDDDLMSVTDLQRVRPTENYCIALFLQDDLN